MSPDVQHRCVCSALAEQIREAHAASRGTYGVRRIDAKIAARSEAAGRWTAVDVRRFVLGLRGTRVLVVEDAWVGAVVRVPRWCSRCSTGCSIVIMDLRAKRGVVA